MMWNSSSSVYDNWGKLYKGVSDREELHRLACCPSLSSTATSDDDISDFLDGEEDYCLKGAPILQIYSYADLKTATNSFRSDMVLGQGGLGTVCKGWVDEKNIMSYEVGITGMMVAIKKLNPESTQGFEEWQPNVPYSPDMSISGRLLHQNLVKLLGYCSEGKKLILVYEFMEKGSLENHLFGRSSAIEPLSWDIRLKIAIGAARGLTFLHNSGNIIYADFNASNILLDGSYNAKLSDVGLAKSRPSGWDSYIDTQYTGPRNDVPEYIRTGDLYLESDVYSFGVVLLEMMTGLEAHDMSRHIGRTNLVDWMKPLLSSKRKLETIMDARIEGQYSAKAALLAAQLTLKCLELEPKKRPSMKAVVEALEQIVAVEKPRGTMSRSAHPSSSHQQRQSPRYPR